MLSDENVLPILLLILLNKQHYTETRTQVFSNHANTDLQNLQSLLSIHLVFRSQYLHGTEDNASIKKYIYQHEGTVIHIQNLNHKP